MIINDNVNIINIISSFVFFIDSLKCIEYHNGIINIIIDKIIINQKLIPQTCIFCKRFSNNKIKLNQPIYNHKIILKSLNILNIYICL